MFGSHHQYVVVLKVRGGMGMNEYKECKTKTGAKKQAKKWKAQHRIGRTCLQVRNQWNDTVVATY